MLWKYTYAKINNKGFQNISFSRGHHLNWINWKINNFSSHTECIALFLFGRLLENLPLANLGVLFVFSGSCSQTNTFWSSPAHIILPKTLKFCTGLAIRSSTENNHLGILYLCEWGWAKAKQLSCMQLIWPCDLAEEE